MPISVERASSSRSLPLLRVVFLATLHTLSGCSGAPVPTIMRAPSPEAPRTADVGSVGDVARHTVVSHPAEDRDAEDVAWFPLEILALGPSTAVAHRGDLAPPVWTRDGGATWVPFEPGVEGDLGDVLVLDGAWYVTVGDAVVRSRDAGRTFARVATLEPPVGVYEEGTDEGRYRASGLREARLLPAGPDTVWIVRTDRVLELSPRSVRTLWSFPGPVLEGSAIPPYSDVIPLEDGAWLLLRGRLLRARFGEPHVEGRYDLRERTAGYAQLGDDEIAVLEAECEVRIRRAGASTWTTFSAGRPRHVATSAIVSPVWPRTLLVACEAANDAWDVPGVSTKILRVSEDRSEVLFDVASLGDRRDIRAPLGPPEVVGRAVWFPQLYASPTFGAVAIGEDGMARVVVVPPP